MAEIAAADRPDSWAPRRRRVKMKRMLRARVECTCCTCSPAQTVAADIHNNNNNNLHEGVRWPRRDSSLEERIYHHEDQDPQSDPWRVSKHAHKSATATTTCHTNWKLTNETNYYSNSRRQTTTTTTTTTSPTGLHHHHHHHGRWSWPRWPHDNTRDTKPGGRKFKTTTCLNHYKAPRVLSSILLLLITMVAATILLATGRGPHIIRTCSAYQLTNNLIANNLPPKFVAATATAGGQTNSEIVVRVKEGPQSIGKLIYTLKGEDPDEDPLTFGVLGTMASDLLRIENVPGNQANVYLRKELDRETTESHQVVITLTDGKLGRGNWVEDVNDNYPVFGPHRTAISVREDARAPLVIETLEATDADEGRFGQVIYKLDETTTTPTTGGSSSAGDLETGSGITSRLASISEMFAIETIDGRGVISLIGQLDYEQRPLYQLRILAIDRAHENERLSTSTSILISVEDCEDQPPMFTFAPSITRIPEDSPVGSPVVRVSAIDGDRGVNAPIKYSLVSVNGQEAGFERNLFSIGSDSGQIAVAHELDRELSLGTSRSVGVTNNQQPGAYVIQVRATEVGAAATNSDNSAQVSVTTELTIILIDVNDELPTFDQPEYLAELLENSPAESLVTFVRPQSSSSQQVVSAIDQDSQLIQQLVVGAKVTDRDQGTNGTFTLHLEGEHGHLFEVWPAEATNEANLMIKVAAGQPAGTNSKYFDYERTKELRLTLVAREKYSSTATGSEPRFSTAEMVIRLRDANDNYPQFDSELYKVEIPENAIRGMHICAVKALDADSGPLGSAGVRYTEIRGERANKFKLDPVTGVITLRTNEHGFDRESVAQHHLIVEARDNLGTGNRNTTQLLIVLTDVNDQRPKFALDQYETFIYENELDFQSPLQVQANDGDAAGTQNSRITYSIVGGDPQGNFTIDPHTGRIRVRTSLVAAAPPLPAGGRPSGADATQPNQQDSTLQVTGGLDFERIAQKRDDSRMFNLTVRAQDSGAPEPLASTAQVIVLVYDKNDHAPVFTRPVYAKSVREDLPGGSPVVQVQAHDGDHSPTNSRITYRVGSGGSDKFVVDSDSGLISIANGANLDIDRVQGGGQRRTSYLLNVLAFDGSFGQNQKSASCLVNISIIDVNNKAPEFVSLGASHLAQPPVGASSQGGSQARAQYGLTNQAGASNQPQVAAAAALGGQQQQVFVNEDAPYGLIVTRVFATDLDSSAELRYSINYARSEARNEDMALVEPSLYRDVFAIEPTDGTIKVNKQLDRELFDQVKLRLQVEDLAAQTADQVAHTYLVIRITDVNDNRPTFKHPLYKAVVNENSISGTQVITMAADDRDLNKTLRYSLEASTPEVARLVRINPRSGEVTVNDKIDRELHPLINVTIKAEDFGQPHSLTGSAQLVITVRDENDNNPIFLNATHLWPHPSARDTARVSGETPTGVVNHNNHLNLSPASSYRLRSLGPPHSSQAGGRFLGEDQPPVLDLSEEQFAGGRPTATFVGAPDTPHPHDENGRELMLLAPGASAQVREDAPVGQQIAYVRAEDADLGNNGRVTYLLDASSSGGGKFRIDRDTGILSVAQPLDREQQSHYTLIIEACDNFDLGYSTGESRRAFTQVSIQVGDINDNPPSISTNLHLTTSKAHHHLHHLRQQAAPPISSSNSGTGSQMQTSRPTYEEAMNSPGPYEMPLSECLFIDEFQALNEPILTISAIDPDDPELPNGQVDLAIINNLPQNEMFSLVPLHGANRPSSGGATTTTISPTGGSPPGTTTTTTTGGGSDLSGFGEHAARRRRRSIETASQLAPHPVGTFYSGRGRTGSGGASTPTTGAPQQVPTTSHHHQVAQVQTIAGGEQQMHLVVSQSLRERVGNYSVLVRATDRGQPALSSLKLVNICVLDVNNHAPVFTRPALNHTIRIMENATIGSYVTQVEASDQDHGLNGELAYSLKATNIQSSNTDWQSFKIDRLSGVITTTKLFNRQFKKYYTLRVQAQDFGRPTSLSSDIDINIMIVNSGKYQPEFEQQTQVLTFTENLAPGVEWFKLLQTTNLDDDPALINANSQQDKQAKTAALVDNWLSSPCYYIVDGDDHEQLFHLDRYTHRLTNQRELDREQGANYTLIVQASNNCQRPPAGTSHSLRLLAPPPQSNQRDQEVSLTTSSSLALTTAGVTELPADGRRVKRSHTGGRAGSETPVVATPTAAPLNGEAPTALPQAASWAASLESLLANDKSLLKVSIRVRDVNDNSPKFTQKIYTGGITTEADFGTVFMIVQATDADADANGQVTYSIVKPIKQNLSLLGVGGTSGGSAFTDSAAAAAVPAQKAALRQKRQVGGSQLTVVSGQEQSELVVSTTGVATGHHGKDQLQVQQNLASLSPLPVATDSDELFLVNAQTGEISLNFDPQKHMKGYFEFEIMARDPEGLSDSARVLIYLLRQDQRVKFVLRLTPQELRQRLNKFRSVFGNITGAIVNIDSYKYFENHDGTVDKKKTSLYLHFVQPEDNTIIEVDKVLTLIDNNIEYLDELYKEFHVLSSEAAHAPLGVGGALVDPIDQVRTGLMGVSSFLALILVLVIALCLNQRTRYERQLKAATVTAFGSSPLHLDPDFHTQTNLPNTNLHSQDPNPIWINGHYGAGGGGQDLVLGSGGHHHHHQGHLWTANGEGGDNHQVAGGTTSKSRGRPGSRSGGGGGVNARNHKTAQKLFNSASSGVGMALDDEELEQSEDEDQLSTSAGRSDELNSSDLNSLSGGGGGGVNSHHHNHHHHHHHHQYNVTSATTATPRDSLASSHGQVSPPSSSSGSNSASTTNERQALCLPEAASKQHKSSVLTGGGKQVAAVAQSSVKVKQQQGSGQVTSAANSTFGGAFKEVTIYTETARHQQQALKLQATGGNASKALSRANNQQQQQQQSSHVTRMASQFNAAKLQQQQQQQQQQQNQSIYVTAQQQQRPVVTVNQKQQMKQSHILIHSNGADVNQGIIITAPVNATPAPQATKQMVHNLDAKFVPPAAAAAIHANNKLANVTMQQQQEQSVNNFETSLSKLSILNLETTEL